MSFDLDTGDCEKLPLSDIRSFSIDDNGNIIAVCYSYLDASASGVYMYSPVSSETKRIDNLDISGYMDTPACAVVSSSNLYYVLNGEIWQLPVSGDGSPVSVNSAPSDITAAFLADSTHVLLSSYNSLQIRSINPADKANVTLHVSSNVYLDTEDAAASNLSERNGDVSVVISRNIDMSALISAMINKSSAIDVYILDTGSSGYAALYNRNYLLDLSSSVKLSAAVSTMYPAFRSSAMKDNRIVSIPLQAYGSTYGYNVNAMKLLGLTEDDLPNTWDELFTFLGTTLPALISDRDDVTAFEGGFAASDLKMIFFQNMLLGYEREYPDSAYNDAKLVSVAEKLDAIDFSALGVSDTYYSEESEDVIHYVDTEVYSYCPALITTDFNLTMGYFEEELRPLFISFTGDNKAPVSVYSAIVNPYSEHKAEAIAYIEELMSCMSILSQYTLFTDKTEPVRPGDFDEYKKHLLSYINDYEKQLAALDEDSDEYDNLKETIGYLQNEYDNLDSIYWTVSPAQIELYQTYSDNLVVAPYTYYYALYTDNNSDEFLSNLYDYCTGKITAASMLAFIESKTGMMKLEDN